MSDPFCIFSHKVKQKHSFRGLWGEAWLKSLLCQERSLFFARVLHHQVNPGFKPGGGGDSHMLADIICLSIDPFFDANLTTNDLVFQYCNSSHLMTPFFKNFNLCTQRESKFKNFVNFQQKKSNLYSNLTQFKLNDPHFWEVQQFTP